MSRHRYAVLDTYRFLAAIGVVIYHFEANLSPFRPHPTDALDRFQTFVDFFFVLSGFVLMHTYGRIDSLKRYRDFLRKRFARIYPLQFVTLMACVALALLVSWRHIPIRDAAFIDMAQLPQNLMLVQAWGTTDRPGLNFPSWSISAELFVYLLFPLFALLVARARPAGALAVALGFALVTDAVRAHLGLRPGDIATYDWGALRAVPTFLAGMAVYVIVEARPPRPISWIWPNALAGIILAMALAKAPIPLIVILYPLLVGLIATAERGGRPSLLQSPVCTRLGDASFAIYMTHTFVAVAAVALVRHEGWTSLAALYAVGAVGILVVIAVSLASYRWFESPMRRWLGSSRRPHTAHPHNAGLGLHRVS